eukprot:PhM_4_TR1434/c0_g1_i2/m.12516
MAYRAAPSSTSTSTIPRLSRRGRSWMPRCHHHHHHRRHRPHCRSDFFDYYRQFNITSKREYERHFRTLVKRVEGIFGKRFPELKAVSRVHVSVVDDADVSAEAWCTPHNTQVLESVIHINLARPVTFEKLQQLVCHEYTHHVQFVLMKLYNSTLPPNTLVGAMTTLLEGGAEYAAQHLVLPRHGSRRQNLIKQFDVKPSESAEQLLRVDDAKQSMSWRAVVKIAKDMHEENNEDNTNNVHESFDDRLRNEALILETGWPSSSFLRDRGAGYVATYSVGSFLLQRFYDAMCAADDDVVDKANSCLWRFWSLVTRCPVPPSVLHMITLAATRTKGDKIISKTRRGKKRQQKQYRIWVEAWEQHCQRHAPSHLESGDDGYEDDLAALKKRLQDERDNGWKVLPRHRK